MGGALALALGLKPVASQFAAVLAAAITAVAPRSATFALVLAAAAAVSLAQAAVITS